MSVKRVLSFAHGGKGVMPRPTILVVTPARFTDHLKAALLAENSLNYSERLQFLFCEHIEEVLASAPDNRLPPIDYVIIVMDPKEGSCIAMAEENMSKIDSMYTKAGRISFVNGACNLRPTEKSIPMGSINSLSQKYSVMLLNGNILDPDKCLHLASSIIRLVSVVIGLHSGIPMSVDISGYF